MDIPPEMAKASGVDEGSRIILYPHEGGMSYEILPLLSLGMQAPVLQTCEEFKEGDRYVSGNLPADHIATSLFSRDDCSALSLLKLIDAHRAFGETSRDLQFPAHRLDVFAQRAHVHVGPPLQL